jgi:hypothetical protein
MPYSNSIGNWQELSATGTITDDWKIYQDSCTSATLFDLQFSTDWEAWNSKQGWHSYGLIRSVYTDLSDNTWFGKSTKIYPNEEPTFLELPIYPSLTGKVILRRIAVKRIWQKYPIPAYGGLTFDDYPKTPTLDWSLAIAYLLN